MGTNPHPGPLGVRQLPYSTSGLERLVVTCVKALNDIVIVTKPQVVSFEVYGSKGFAVLEWTLASSRDIGVLSIADVKHSDIDLTMAAYAGAWLSGGSPSAADALTVPPHFGSDALGPAVSLALGNGRGLFVLAAMSNPEGASV